MDQDQDLAQRLKSARNAVGISQADASAASGIPWDTIAKAEQGRLKLSLEKLYRLAECYGINPQDLDSRLATKDWLDGS